MNRYPKNYFVLYQLFYYIFTSYFNISLLIYSVQRLSLNYMFAISVSLKKEMFKYTLVIFQMWFMHLQSI